MREGGGQRERERERETGERERERERERQRVLVCYITGTLGLDGQEARPHHEDNKHSRFGDKYIMGGTYTTHLCKPSSY
jgi:hypothetical protein